ncbi:hypothetical protein G6F46_013965 [Rhizopus delemar]|nr:hypothetical protein G6F46_013965 [Rhizopus delemar]
MKGLSGISNDMRELLASDAPSAQLALKYFAWRVAEGMSGLGCAMNGIDGIVFTAGVGENSADIRQAVADHWGWRWGIGVVSIIAIASTVLLWLQLPPSRHFQARRGGLRQLPSRWRALFADPGLPWLFATSFVLMGVFVTLYNYLGYHLLAPPPRATGAAASCRSRSH